jgi:hypothetical protein
MLAEMALNEELSRIAERAATFAADGEELAGVVAAEPAGGRAYVCAYRCSDGQTSWLVLDADGEPVESRELVRDAVSIAAMCEVAEEVAGGGDLDELRSQLVAVRLTEDAPGIEDAEDALLALQATIGSAPRVASPRHLDAVGTATQRLERALDDRGGSAFSQAMKAAVGSVEELARDVEARYKRELR